MMYVGMSVEQRKSSYSIGTRRHRVRGDLFAAFAMGAFHAHRLGGFRRFFLIFFAAAITSIASITTSLK